MKKAQSTATSKSNAALKDHKPYFPVDKTTNSLRHIITLTPRPLVVIQPRPAARDDNNTRRPTPPILAPALTLAVLIPNLLGLLLNQRHDLYTPRIQTRGISPRLCVRQLDLRDGAIALHKRRLLAGALGESGEGRPTRRGRGARVVAVAAAAEEAGEEAADEGFEGRWRGADYAYIYFD